jgi:hypothetical protein
MWSSVLEVGDEPVAVTPAANDEGATESEQLTPVDFGG